MTGSRSPSTTKPATPPDTRLFNLQVIERDPDSLGVAAAETHRNVSLSSASPRYLGRVLDQESALLRLPAPYQGLEEARHLLESARTLRRPVLEELLAHVQRIKVARLACHMAQELGLPWADLAHQHSARLGGGARWVSTTPAGDRLNLKRPAA